MRQIMHEELPITESSPIKARYYDYARFTYPWHFHSQYEIIYVKEGYGQCFVGDCIERFEAGDVIIFGSNLPHYMRHDDAFEAGDPALRLRGTIIQFERNFMSYSFNSYPQLFSIKTLLEEARRGILFRGASAGHIRHVLESFPKLGGVAEIGTLLFLLDEMAMTEGKRALATPHYYERFSVKDNKRINKVIAYLNSHYTKRIDLKEIAERAIMNPSAFCRCFKESTGKTLLQYVTDMRIGYACKLLMMRDMEVAQIAVECGFESITHFNRTFKQLTGFTPTQYRQTMLK